MDAQGLKILVKEKYSEIAEEQSGCGCGCCGDQSLEFSMIGEEYKNLEGHVQEADLGLGCGIPTEFAQIKPGDSVLDLGSGAGNDCFVARAIVGETGQVTGLDFSGAMVKKALQNIQKLTYHNVKFIEGDIENMPFPSGQFDVVISNCVLNLVPDKNKAFSEIYRVLKPGGHFCISDVVIRGELPASLKEAAEMYVGCVAGALPSDRYMDIIERSGFINMKVQRITSIEMPENILQKYLDEQELQAFRKSGSGIASITVYAEKG